MCGISGIISNTRINDIEKRIERMNAAIMHRGPDAGGKFVLDNSIALGHRRLSIIDTAEHANQPMHSNSGRWHVVFNGEIYNFKEIKAQLGYNFQTLSDTETIIAAVEEKGVDWFLSHAIGMFSIGLFDSVKRETFIIRDRLGIKPLYFYRDEEKFIFASEIKAILESGLVEVDFNYLAVDEYLANRYVRTPYTFFKEIFQVEPGFYIKLDSRLNTIVVKYWDLPNEFNFQNSYNEGEILEAFDEALTKAIKYRLIADVPLGTYLSGGVDSSIITAITALNKAEKINTYTIGFPELNEFDYSDVVAKMYDTIHHKIVMDQSDYLEKWENLIYFKDAPLGVPNEIPLAEMSTKLKEKITVVLSGEGADELMGGYGKIFRSPYDYVNANHNNSFYDYFISLYEYVPRHMRDHLINTNDAYRHEFDDLIKTEFNRHPNEENIFRFFHKYHVRGLLQRVDMTTMQTAVEARVPFLDHTLIEFAYSKIPYDLKLRWKNAKAKEDAKRISSNSYSEVLDTPKYLLRKLSYKYLPKEIIERRKVGFPVPLTEWFKNLEELSRTLLPKADWLKEGVYEDLIKRSKEQERAGQILWMFINVELFRKQYFSKTWKW